MIAKLSFVNCAVVACLTTLLLQSSLFAQETPPPQAAVDISQQQSTSTDGPIDGPLLSERKKIRESIQAAEKRGVGTSAYKALFLQIEESIRKGETEDKIRPSVERLQRALKEQETKKQLFTVQFGNLCVVTNPAKAEIKVFDPAHRPDIAGIPTDMDAVTNFNIHRYVHVNWNDGSETISKADVTLNCTAVIWIPSNCTQKLKDHELGHLKICEALYQKGNLIAREIGQRYLMGCDYGGGQAITTFEQKYQAEVIDVIGWLYNCYDTITDHGRNQVSANDAVNQCFRLCYSKYKRYLEK